MPTLYGWGSNAHGQLGRPLTELVVSTPVAIRNANRICAVSGSQVLFSEGDQLFQLGFEPCLPDGSTTGVQISPDTECVVGQDCFEACIEHGQLKYGPAFRMQGGDVVWRDAAMDLRGRIAAITGSYGGLTQTITFLTCFRHLLSGQHGMGRLGKADTYCAKHARVTTLPVIVSQLEVRILYSLQHIRNIKYLRQETIDLGSSGTLR